MGTLKHAIDQTIGTLSSVKLALVVLIILAVTAIGGTIIPQDLPPEKYLEAYGPVLYTFLSYLDMYDMYNSWWFTLLMALLVLNLFVCSLNRLPQTMKLSRRFNPRPVDPNFFKKRMFSRQIDFNGSLEEYLPLVKKVVTRRFGRPGEFPQTWGAFLWAEKGSFSRFGAYVVHSSIFFIVAGALVGSFWGFSAFLNLPENEAASQVIGSRPPGVIELPFSIRLDKFTVSFYANGQPSGYRSDVTVIEGGQAVKKAAIRVNHPLTHRGVTFYQSSYGREAGGLLKFKATRLEDGKTFDLEVRQGAVAPLPEGAGTVMVQEFVEDVMNLGPAARLVIRDRQGQAFNDWAFGQRPSFLPPPQSPFTFNLVDVEIGYYTGLQVNKDPGVWLIWIGCGLMILGFLMIYLFAHRKLYVGLIADGNKISVLLAGSSHRARGAFGIYFDRLGDELAGLAKEGTDK